MPLISAWQCPKTKKLFADKSAYRKHLIKIARKRYQERTEERFISEAETYIQTTLRTCVSFEAIADWFLDPGNARLLANRINRLSWSPQPQ